jgi:prophage tail gpP-like protein
MILRINDRIRNRKVEFFNEFNVNLRYDSIASTFSFSGFFNPDNTELKELYCVGHYHIATLEHNGELLLTGYVLSESFNHAEKDELVSISGYSLPGFLEDCEIPTSLYPLELGVSTLREIATKLIAPFKLKMVVDPSVASLMDKQYDKTTASESQTIKGYLTELAAQKNIIISHNQYGNVLFTRAKTKQQPILNYGEVGGAPFTNMNLSFNGQAMHSDITVIRQATKNNPNSGRATVKNPYVPYVYRPKVVVQTSGDDIDTEQAARNVLSAELKNLRLTIETDRWEIDGKIIKPNSIISVVNPKVYLFKKSNWFVESIDFKGDNKKTIATLNCVIPEVYNNDTPTYLFKGINLH